MDIVNPNYLNYMEQIQKNRKDIENLYDQELSDITQLNFKEHDENGLDYENGKATFYGKSTIIRDENTENLEVDSKVELKISSGDDDIVIDAGEDNSTLEIHLDNETRNKINRALLTPINIPTERSFVMIGTNNSQELVGEKELLQNNIMCATLTSDYIFSNSNNYEQLPIEQYNSSGNKLRFENNRIYVGEGVSKVKISGMVQFNVTNEGNIFCAINKNENRICFTGHNSKTGNASIAIPPFVINTGEENYFTLWGYIANSGNNIIGSSSIRTYLTVEVVE